MKDYRRDFATFEGNIWLNAAGQGPMPLAAAETLREAILWKCSPWLLDYARFSSVIIELKKGLGRLLHVPDNDVILGNSASYGLHLLANGVPWRAGDQILLMQNDFPTNILPWLGLASQGVQVVQIPPKQDVLSPEEFLQNLTPKTRLLCLSHVHSFTGITLDIEKIAGICREKKIVFVLNASQSIGTMPMNVLAWGADAVVATGYKWLCGPYGTGFCWIKPELREQLQLNLANWTAVLSHEELRQEGPLSLRDIRTARRYDVFGTANYFNFVPLKTCVDYWLNVGLEEVWAHNQGLVDKLVDGLRRKGYILISPAAGRFRSGLVVFSHRDKSRNQGIFSQLNSRGISTALWKDNLRVSPHLYNTEEEISVLLENLHERD